MQNHKNVSSSAGRYWPTQLLSLFLLLLLLRMGRAEESGEELPQALLEDVAAVAMAEEAETSSTTTMADPKTPPPPPASLLDHQAKQIFSLSKKFDLICCAGGVPQLIHPALVRNFTFTAYSTTFPGESSGADTCRLFKGSYLLPQPSLLFGVSIELSYAAHVQCKCPEAGMGHDLDAQCRRLPGCQNNGFRSPLDPRRCFCLEPFFGEHCEKFCDRGRRMRGRDGRDYCSCAPLYLGEECRDRLCMNGGRPSADGAGCDCAPHFLGFHCEIDANRTQPSLGGIGGLGGNNLNNHFVGGSTGSGSSRFHHQRFGPEQNSEMFSRDVSGTVFSLVMIVVLVLSMYLLMKHRMQVQTRYLSSRRADLLGACNFPPPPTMAGPATVTAGGGGGPGQTVTTARRVELLPMSAGDHHHQHQHATMARGFPPFVRSLAPFFASDGGPPPYAPPGQRVRRSRNEVLPPLPSYEDATKLPAVRTATLVMEEMEGEQPPPALTPEDDDQQQHGQLEAAAALDGRREEIANCEEALEDGDMRMTTALELVELGEAGARRTTDEAVVGTREERLSCGEDK